MIIHFSRLSALVGSGVLVINPDPSRLIIGRESLANAEFPLRDDCLYTGKVSELSAVIDKIAGGREGGNSSILLFKDENIPASFLKRNRSNIILTKSLDEFNRLNDEIRFLLDIQAQVNLFSNRLLSMVQNEASAKRLLDFGYSIFGNPLLLTDPSLALIASAGTETVDDDDDDGDDIIGQVLAKGYMPNLYIEEVMQEERELPEEGETLLVREKVFMGNRILACRIVRGDRLIGYVKIFERNQHFTEVRDVEMLKVLCQHLAVSMDSWNAPRQTEFSFIESFLLDIINQKVVGHDTIRRLADNYNLELQTYKTAVIVELEDRYKNTNKLYLLKHLFQNHFRRKTCFLYDGNIVILYDQNTSKALFDKTQMQMLEKLLEETHCRAAVSVPFKSLDRFHIYFKQAETCLEIANILRIGKRILRYDDHFIDHMLLHYRETFDLRDLIAPSVKSLSVFDAHTKKEGNLLNTLFTFAQNNLDYTASSKALHIHYNTLKYRIGRIKNITDIDFDDSQEILRIRLSECVMQLLERISDSESHKS
ncbi:MAG: helix-turn-helix domain-containing protein [Coriobacteriales bacterium]|jgi:sugar diacid utilization regulator|nr:helix-turn-helix domain-containing protein [Coriobacteriales bacterium]